MGRLFRLLLQMVTRERMGFSMEKMSHGMMMRGTVALQR